MNQPATPTNPDPSPASTLPGVPCELDNEQVISRLDAAARRGRLPDFTKGPPGLFTVGAFGGPFDYRLVAQRDAAAINFSLVMKLKMPVITVIVLVLTVWPGVWLTDSMIRTYFESYDYATWMWYLPITVLPTPWMWAVMVRRSRAAATDHALELIERVRAEVGTPASKPNA
jgi:hypothetical protein